MNAFTFYSDFKLGHFFPSATLYTIKQNEIQLTLGRSRKNCTDGLTIGELLHTLHRGLISSVALTRWPHPSHWSPRASSYLHPGHVPSTNLSAKNLSHFSQSNWSTLSEFIYPLSFSLRNKDCTSLRPKGFEINHQRKSQTVVDKHYSTDQSRTALVEILQNQKKKNQNLTPFVPKS